MVNLTIRIDENVKKQADSILSELGLSMSAATNIFLKQVVRHNGLPFEIKLDPPKESNSEKGGTEECQK